FWQDSELSGAELVKNPAHLRCFEQMVLIGQKKTASAAALAEQLAANKDTVIHYLPRWKTRWQSQPKREILAALNAEEQSRIPPDASRTVFDAVELGLQYLGRIKFL